MSAIETPVLSTGKTFDYAALDANTVVQVREITERVRTRTKEFYLETGRDLIKVQEMLKHGEFGKWLNAEFGWTDRTARRLMAAATLVDSKSDKLSVLPIATIYDLASPSTPEAARNAIVERVENGEVIPAKEIKAAIADARQAHAAEQTKQADNRAEQKQLDRLTPASRERSKKKKAERQKQRETEKEEQAQREQAAEAAADQAIAFLVERLGADLPTFAELVKAAAWRFERKLSAALTGPRS